MLLPPVTAAGTTALRDPLRGLYNTLGLCRARAMFYIRCAAAALDHIRPDGFITITITTPIGAQSTPYGTQKISSRALFCAILERKSHISKAKIHDAVTQARLGRGGL